MIKTIPAESYNYDEPPIQLIKWGRYGIGPNDRKALIKRAGELFVEQLRKMAVAPGEALAHNLALGATEYWGSNRNGDGFKCAECRKNHPTFVKYGHAFRHHKNDDPKKSYGVVKLSHFNEGVKRVELAVAYNATKEAADRNGGLVADEEMEALEKDGYFPTSMATHVPYDICSGCDNKARNRGEYCHGSMCKYGGLRDNIGKTFADGHTLHADNPHNRWFDISLVKRGADRTSYTLGLIEKAASVVKTGAELAEEYGIRIPIRLLHFEGAANSHLKVASELICGTPPGRDYSVAFSPAAQPALTALPDLKGRGEKLAHAMRALAEEKVILPVRDFLALMLGDVKLAAEITPRVAPHVPAAYMDLVDSGEEFASTNPFRASDRAAPHATRQWAAKLAADYSLAREHVLRRAAVAAIRGTPHELINVNQVSSLQKSATAIRSLARQYAMYKVAAVAAMDRGIERDWLLSAAVLQDLAAH
jgi:hypothetical protein